MVGQNRAQIGVRETLGVRVAPVREPQADAGEPTRSRCGRASAKRRSRHRARA
jgi:hypothetical protein